MKHTKIASRLAGGLLALSATNAQAGDKLVLPEDYIEGMFHVSAARMTADVCPRIELKGRIADMYQMVLSMSLQEDGSLPSAVSPDDEAVKDAVHGDKRFAERVFSLFIKYEIDPGDRTDTARPEVYEKFCALGTGEIEAASPVGKLIQAVEE